MQESKGGLLHVTEHKAKGDVTQAGCEVLLMSCKYKMESFAEETHLNISSRGFMMSMKNRQKEAKNAPLNKSFHLALSPKNWFVHEASEENLLMVWEMFPIKGDRLLKPIVQDGKMAGRERVFGWFC